MITIISNSNVFSGNAARIINLSRNLKNIEVIFSSPEVKIKGINIDFTHSKNKIFALCEKSIKVLLKNTNLIHCFKTLPTSGIPSLFGKLKKLPFILDWDDYEGFGGFADKDPFPYNYIIDYFEKWIVKKTDVLTVVSPFLKEKAIELGFDGEVYLIPNGADISIKYCLPRETEKLKLLFIGLLYKSSDLDLALKAMCFLTDMKLIVVGDGPRRKEFELLSKKLRLNNVEFVGMKSHDEVRNYLYNTDITLLPFMNNISNKSRSPIKLGEYLAAGKPVVTNPVGIMKNLIKDGFNGILSRDNPENFAEGINRLINFELRKKISKNARKTAEKYDWKKIAKNLEKIYEEFL